jgi:hypothetical protein
MAYNKKTNILRFLQMMEVILLMVTILLKIKSYEIYIYSENKTCAP